MEARGECEHSLLSLSPNFLQAQSLSLNPDLAVFQLTYKSASTSDVGAGILTSVLMWQQDLLTT